MQSLKTFQNKKKVPINKKYSLDKIYFLVRKKKKKTGKIFFSFKILLKFIDAFILFIVIYNTIELIII